MGQPGSARLPLTDAGPSHPPADAAAPGTHGHAGGGGVLDNLVLEADGRRILVKGRTSKEMVLAEETEKTEVYRERLKTTVVALDLDEGAITDIAA